MGEIPLQNIKVRLYQVLLLPRSPSVGCGRLLFFNTRHFVCSRTVLAVAFSLARDGEVSILIVYRRRCAVWFDRRWLRHVQIAVDELW